MSNRDNSYQLPLTHYDKLKKVRPGMWEYVTNDIEILREGHVSIPIASVDDFSDKNLLACVEHFVNLTISKVSESSGIPVEQIKPVAKQMPQIGLLVAGINQDYHNILNFEIFNKKTFYFGDNLSEHLLATELSIDSELLRTPFDSCMFVYTSPSVVDAAFSFMKVQASPSDVIQPLSVFVTQLPDKTTTNGRKILMAITHWNGNNCSFYVKREVAIRPSWKIEQSLRTDWESLGDTDGEGLRLSANGDNRTTSDSEFYTDGLSLFRLILNSILYLSSSDPDILQRTSGRPEALIRASAIKSTLKSKKARQNANKESALDYYSVGENITPIYVHKNLGDKEVNSEQRGFKEYAARFIVRGHWRNQPCGHNMTDRKLIWIKPYYKGPEIADLVNRPYIVK